MKVSFIMEPKKVTRPAACTPLSKSHHFINEPHTEEKVERLFSIDESQQSILITYNREGKVGMGNMMHPCSCCDKQVTVYELDNYGRCPECQINYPIDEIEDEEE